MILRILSFILFLGFALQSYAKLEFDKKQIVATLKPSVEIYEFEFAFKNIGDAEDVVSEIKSDCDCTDVVTDKKAYAVGESGVLKGVFKVGDRLGLQNKKITLITGGGEKYILSLRLTVPELASFRPKMLMWKQGDTPASKILKIDTAREYGARIVSASCGDENFKIEFTPQREHSDNCEVKITPLSLEKSGRVELLLKCVARDNVEKQYTIHLLVK